MVSRNASIIDSPIISTKITPVRRLVGYSEPFSMRSSPIGAARDGELT
jgi:hypothetical protein